MAVQTAMAPMGCALCACSSRGATKRTVTVTATATGGDWRASVPKPGRPLELILNLNSAQRIVASSQAQSRHLDREPGPKLTQDLPPILLLCCRFFFFVVDSSSLLPILLLCCRFFFFARCRFSSSSSRCCAVQGGSRDLEIPRGRETRRIPQRKMNWMGGVKRRAQKRKDSVQSRQR